MNRKQACKVLKIEESRCENSNSEYIKLSNEFKKLVKKQHRKLAKENHPDTTTDAALKLVLNQKIQKINNAYEILSPKASPNTHEDDTEAPENQQSGSEKAGSQNKKSENTNSGFNRDFKSDFGSTRGNSNDQNTGKKSRKAKSGFNWDDFYSGFGSTRGNFKDQNTDKNSHTKSAAEIYKEASSYASKGDYSQLQSLLNKHFNAGCAPSDSDESPLSTAILNNRKDIITLLLGKFDAKFSKFDFTRTDNKDLPINLLKNIDTLIKSSPDCKNLFATALQFDKGALFTHSNLQQIAYHNLNDLASIFAKSTNKISVNHNAESALSHAILSGKTELAKLLVSNANVGKFSKFDFTRTDNKDLPINLLKNIDTLIKSSPDCKNLFATALQFDKGALFTHSNLQQIAYHNLNDLASIFAKSTNKISVNHNAESALSHAILSGKTELAKLLVSNANVGKFSKFDFTRTDNKDLPINLLKNIDTLIKSSPDCKNLFATALKFDEEALFAHINLQQIAYHNLNDLASIFAKSTNKISINHNAESALSHAILSGKTELAKLLVSNANVGKFSKFDFTRTDNKDLPKNLVKELPNYCPSQGTCDKLLESFTKVSFAGECHLVYDNFCLDH